MKFENEITVEVDVESEKLLEILENNNFKVMETYDVNDIYMIDHRIEKTNKYLEMLRHCVLLRNIIEKDKDTKKIVYKYKEYNDKEEIVKQGKAECKVWSIEDAKNLLEAIGYEELIRIQDHLIVFANEKDQLTVQYVNNKHIYIEIEEKCEYLNKNYDSIEEMKEVIKRYDIPIKGENYFVKKAEIEMKETLK